MPARTPMLRRTAAGRQLRLRLVWVPVALAVLLRGLQLARPGYLFGITEYDDGVYLGETLRLLHGVMPYRDYPVVHPPGILVVLVPFAAFSHLAGTDGVLAMTRVFTALVDVANVVVIGRVLRPRGRGAQLVAMTFLAAYPDSVAAAHTVLLEPYLDLLCLLGVLVLFDGGSVSTRRRVIGAGTLFGLAGTVKIFAILPVLGILVLLVVRRRRIVAPFGAGVVAGFASVSLPFALLAPGRFVREVVVDQVFRTSAVRTPLADRLSDLDGMSLFGLAPLPSALLVALGLGGAIACTLMVVRFRRLSGSAFDDLERFTLLAVVAVVAALLSGGEFYYHYASFAGPFLGLFLGLFLPDLVRRSALRRLLRSGVVVGAAAFVVLEIGGLQNMSAPGAPAVLGRVLAKGACVFSDEASYTIVADEFDQVPGCPVLVDSDGATLAYGDGAQADQLEIRGGAAVVARWEGVLVRYSYLVLSTGVRGSIPMTTGMQRFIGTRFSIVAVLPDGLGRVYRRHPPPAVGLISG